MVYNSTHGILNKTQSHSKNGQLVDSNIQMGNYTSYPSSFLVVDPDGIYSKHYYAGTQRIAVRMGQHNADELFADKKKTAKLSNTEENTDNAFNPEELKTLQQQDLQQYLDKAGKVTRLSFKKYKPSQTVVQEQQQENENNYVAYGAMAEELIYYYHPDHLGTATYLTDINGEAYEFFLNLPFGETMAEQHSQTADYVNRWKFTGHELDRETGLYYAGARYYDPKISIWLSVDPLAEKYPNWNPYAYTFQNPINFIDPDGREGRAVLDEDCCGDNGDRPFGQPDFNQQPPQDSSITPSTDDSSTSSTDDSSTTSKNEGWKKWGKIIGDFMSGGQVSQMEESLELLETEGFNSYLYSQVGSARSDIRFSMMGQYRGGKAGKFGNANAAKGGIQLTKKTFGHTFTTHGDDMTNFLINRAKGSGMAQGQFLNNQKAAQFILDNVGKTANGAVNIPIPKDFPARVIMPDGTFKTATHIRLVPGGGGVKTAYPLIP